MTLAADIPKLTGRDPSLWEKKRLTKKHASSILDTIGAFYAWEPKLEPPLPDLEQRAREAIWWNVRQPEITEVGVHSRGATDPVVRRSDAYRRPIPGVRVFTPSQAQQPWDSLRASLWASLRASLSASLSASLRASLRASLSASLSASLWASLRDSLGNSIRASLLDSLLDSLFYSVMLAVRERRPAVEFKPLFDLWLAGNYPVGFDRHDRLVVLVADAPAPKARKR